MIKVPIVGSRDFGALVFKALRREPGVKLSLAMEWAACFRLRLT